MLEHFSIKYHDDFEPFLISRSLTIERLGKLRVWYHGEIIDAIFLSVIDNDTIQIMFDNYQRITALALSEIVGAPFDVKDFAKYVEIANQIYLHHRQLNQHHNSHQKMQTLIHNLQASNKPSDEDTIRELETKCQNLKNLIEQKIIELKNLKHQLGRKYVLRYDSFYELPNGLLTIYAKPKYYEIQTERAVEKNSDQVNNAFVIMQDDAILHNGMNPFEWFNGKHLRSHL